VTTESHSTLPLNLAAGQKLAGCYLLVRLLEAGGDHLIWIAQDEVLGKEVSLHFLPASISQDAAAIEQLHQEVKRNRPLIHPGILRVFDLVEGPDWTAVAMESFDGQCLAALLEEEGGRFEVEHVEPLLAPICESLEEAHRIKLTHRDLAPENVFINASGHVWLASFGISRVVQDSLRRSSGKAVRTPRLHTLSPQLLDGAAPSPTDDVYGVGTLLFALLAGHPVFADEDGGIAEKIRRTVPPRLSEVRDDADDPGKLIPPGWDNVVAACLNKQSDERPHRPAEIVSSIEAYLPPVETAEIASGAEEPEIPEALTEIEASHPPVEEPAPSVSEPSFRLAEPVKFAEPENPIEVVEPVVAEAESPSEIEAPAPETPVPSAVDAILLAPVESASPVPVIEPPAPVAKPAPPASVPRPIKHYDTDEDAFSAILPRRFRFPAAVAAAVIFLLLLINGVFTGGKDKNTTPPKIATSDAAERSELTAVKNSAREKTAIPEPVKPAASTPVASQPPPEPKATQKAPMNPEILVAAAAPAKAATPPPATPTVAPVSTAGGMPLDKQIAEKAAAVERIKQELAAAEKAQQARLKEQQVADAALVEARKAIDDKSKAAAAAKKVADELVAERKKRQDDQKNAETAAMAAQQLAEEKARAAEDAKKALVDFEMQNRDKLAAQDKTDAEVQALQRTLAERQKLAEDGAKAAAATEAARQQQIAALQQTEQELAQIKANAAKASVEEQNRRQAVDAERRKLDDEIAAMRALFEQKMKDIEDRRRQIENGAAAPAASVALPPPAAKPAATPTAVLATPAPVATPIQTLPLMAMKTEPTVPVATPASTPPPVQAPPVAVAGGNSLGMRFAPVGDVFFSVWQTRVKDFEAFAKAVNLKSTAWRGPGFRQGPDHPVVNVTWNEALAFCKWLTDKEHKEGTLPANQFYRLPYDLEWSKAVALPDESGKTAEARDMGVPDVYPWGTAWPPPKGAGNYTGEETGSDVAIKGYDDGFAWTSPVGSFPPNKFGLYDMGGNVWQWCMDSWNSESKAKVLRGASWYNGALKLSLLSSCRVHAAPDSSTDNYGFRIVRAIETTPAKPAKK
jgi:serine/threonine protein kinase